MPVYKNVKTYLIVLLVLITAFVTLPTIVWGGCADIEDLDEKAKCYENKIEDKQEEYESTSKKLSDIRNRKDTINATISKFLNELTATEEEMQELEDSLDLVDKDLTDINNNLTDRKGKLSQKIDLRNKAIRNYSKRSFNNELEVFFSVIPTQSKLDGFQYSSFAYMFRKALTKEAVRIIYILNTEIDTYEKDKVEAEKLRNELEDAHNSLLALKRDLDNKKAQAQNEVKQLDSKQKSVEDDLEDLEDEIAELSSKQQAILNQKQSNENGSVGDYEAPEVKTPNPPFSPAFASFSYGAYTHYKGMSQYGAKARAEEGKKYSDILKFYYKADVTEKSVDKICVEGYGTMDFQKYLYGLAEMPSNWPSEALKAQAIAGRSYAYRYAKDGKCICTSQSCQVFLKSKSDNPPSSWKKAVDDTKGKILSGDVVAYYSSTTGGYIENIGWDVKSKWPDNAYEKIAESPWFRKAWYTKSYNDSSNCGRSHPWLKEEEMADIVNAWVVWSKGSSSEKAHISPVTTSCWGGDPYSIDEMRETAAKYGGGFTKVSKVSTSIGNNGYTTKVELQTNSGTVSIDGQTFKTVFNLRSPSYISIKSRLFDFEKKD